MLKTHEFIVEKSSSADSKPRKKMTMNKYLSKVKWYNDEYKKFNTNLFTPDVKALLKDVNNHAELGLNSKEKIKT